MSYEGSRQNQPSGYGQQGRYGQGQGGYGQYNPYAEATDDNAYQQQTAGHGNNQPYSTRPEAHAQPSSQYGDAEQGDGRYEMSNIQSRDPNAILNECRNIDQGIDSIDKQINTLQGLHKQALSSTDQSQKDPAMREVARHTSDIKTEYQNFIARIRRIKQNPESGNPRNAPQVGRVQRRLKDSYNRLLQADQKFNRDAKEQEARRYRTVRPDATDAEVQEFVENSGNTQVFQKALMNADRRGEAQSILTTVQERHMDIQKIEQILIEVAQLFQDMEAVVVQQEPQVTQIEQRGEEVTENVGKANVEIDTAIKSARAARRKKFWCFLIVLLIIIIIVVVVVVVVEVGRKKSK